MKLVKLSKINFYFLCFEVIFQVKAVVRDAPFTGDRIISMGDLKSSSTDRTVSL
jgi:hypothetical protein